MKLSIIIPTYNEKNNIRPLLTLISEALASVEYEVIFVDDSKDETPQILAEVSSQDSSVRYLHRTGEMGLASAVVRGFAMAKGDIIAVMDADLQHPASLLPQMLALIDQGADIVLPSRYIAGGGSEGLNMMRTIASKGARLLCQVFLTSMRRISDPMSGYFMMSRDVIEGVDFHPVGWKILMEVLTLGRYYNVAEISYSFEKRNAGESKLTSRVMFEYLLHIGLLVLRSERERRFYLFACVGLSGVAVDQIVFSIISSAFLLPLHLAATLSGCVAMVSNYLLNCRMTWRNQRQDDTVREFLQYAVVCAAGMSIKNIVAYLFSLAGMENMWCNFLGILIASLWNYFISDRWVFSGKKDQIQYTKISRQDNMPSLKEDA